MDPVRSRYEELLDEYGRDDLSVAWALCDRHPADAVALTVVGPDSAADYTYGELHDRSARFAAGLAAIGVGAGSRVATLLPKGIELIVAVLGIWRLGAVYVPLFTAFAPLAIASRLQASGTVVVVCANEQRYKLDHGRDMPSVSNWRIVIVGELVNADDLAYTDLLEGHGRIQERAVQGAAGAMIQLYTSGTTGTPKGVVVPAWAIASMVAYFEYGLDVRPDDVYWNAADPGWAYGLYYAIVAPLAAGRQTVLASENFYQQMFWRTLEDLSITNVAAAPTIYRALRSSDSALARQSNVRAASSAGEPLTVDVAEWTEAVLGVPVLDHYGQTELGMAVINGHHPSVRGEVRAGSMGRAMPGFSIVVLDQQHDHVTRLETVGRIAVDTASSPLMWFTGYDNDPAKSFERFTADGRYYLTGDAGRMDADGYVYFSGRHDDVILMAGYRIGPFEIESVLLTHERVAECAVVGVPDEVRGEIVKAYVVLAAGGPPPDDSLATELQDLVRTRYAVHAYPRRVQFVESLPKTTSGKVQRFRLRDSGS